MDQLNITPACVALTATLPLVVQLLGLPLIAKPEFRLAPKANAQGGVWHMPHARDNAHPAPFPVELAQRCISATAGGVVLDPFMGSGTTAIAAERVNREWIGAEHSREYCRMAEDRIKKHQERKRA